MFWMPGCWNHALFQQQHQDVWNACKPQRIEHEHDVLHCFAKLHAEKFEDSSASVAKCFCFFVSKDRALKEISAFLQYERLWHVAMLQSLVHYIHKNNMKPNIADFLHRNLLPGSMFWFHMHGRRFQLLFLETQLLVTLKCRRGAVIIIMWHVHLSTAVRISTLGIVGGLDSYQDGGKSYHPEN